MDEDHAYEDIFRRMLNKKHLGYLLERLADVCLAIGWESKKQDPKNVNLADEWHGLIKRLKLASKSAAFRVPWLSEREWKAATPTNVTKKNTKNN